MNLKDHTNRINKRGSYILEAAIVLPVFIVSIISLALTVKAMSIVETVVFDECMHLHEANIEAPFCTPLMGNRYCKLNEERILFSENGIDDLILIDSNINFRICNAFGINQNVNPEIRILSRAFTGKANNADTLEYMDFVSDDPSKEVVIFPKYGTKYHRKDCRYVNQEYVGEEEKIELQYYEALMRGYTPCLVCGG